jgi:hypothetical protein
MPLDIYSDLTKKLLEVGGPEYMIRTMRIWVLENIFHYSILAVTMIAYRGRKGPTSLM